MTQDAKLNLIEVLEQLSEAAEHLKISMTRCKPLSLDSKNEESLIEFEALAIRFARVVNILIQKVYRSIDSLEFVSGGTLIDVMNRADKRNLIDSVQEMRFYKDMRNDITHEYLSERMQQLCSEILQRTPKLLELVHRVFEYCEQYNQK